MLLTDHFVEGPGSHAHSKRCGCRGFRTRSSIVSIIWLGRGKQILHVSTLLIAISDRYSGLHLGPCVQSSKLSLQPVSPSMKSWSVHFLARVS